MNNPFFVDLNEGLARVIAAHGDRLVTLDAQFNSLKQKNDISDLLQQRPAAIFVNPVNWEGIRGSLAEAKRKGVPVIVVDAPVSDPDMVLCQVASDNVEAGRLAAAGPGRGQPQGQGRHPAPLDQQGVHRPRRRLQGGRRPASRDEDPRHPGGQGDDRGRPARDARPAGPVPRARRRLPDQRPQRPGGDLGHRVGRQARQGHRGLGRRLEGRRSRPSAPASCTRPRPSSPARSAASPPRPPTTTWRASPSPRTSRSPSS